MATFITSKAVGESIIISGYHDEFYYQKSILQTDTGYWKYYHDGVYSNVLGDSASNTNQTISVTNANGEFTLISCDSSGTPSGNIVHLKLPNNQITSFDGSSLTGLVNLSLTNNSISSVNNLILPSSLGVLNLTSNQLTSFSGVGLTNLVQLSIDSNQLTSFNSTGLSNLSMLGLSANQLTSFSGAGLTSLTMLSISNNQLSTFDKTDLTNLTMLRLSDNQLTSINITGLTNLNYLEITNNPFNKSLNDSIMDILNSNGINNGTIYSSNGRTSAGTADYNSLVSKGWSLYGLDLAQSTTFITSKAVGTSFTISGHHVGFSSLNSYIQTDTGYWKYYHNGVYSSVFGDSYSNISRTITVANANGEFTFISCNSNGTPSGNITHLVLPNNQITSFNGSDLTGLINLQLMSNSISNFNSLVLPSSLMVLVLTDNQLTSFSGTGLTNLIELQINACSLTSFNGTDLSSLTILGLQYNQLTSINLTGLTSLVNLGLKGNQLTSLDISGLANLNALYISENPITRSINDSILDVLNSNSVNGGTLMSENGRTSAGTADYNSLISRGWSLTGVDLPLTPPTPTPPPRLGIRGNWGGNNWNESNTPNDYIPNPIPENGNWNGGNNGTSGNPSE